eukprot:scaffold12093_cov137-Isochrysis_galbana.AAC.1
MGLHQLLDSRRPLEQRLGGQPSEPRHGRRVPAEGGPRPHGVGSLAQRRVSDVLFLQRIRKQSEHAVALGQWPRENDRGERVLPLQNGRSRAVIQRFLRRLVRRPPLLVPKEFGHG